MQSKKYQLNKQDLLKIGKGALIATGGALLTYVTSVIQEIDFGSWTPLVVAFSSIIINAVHKILSSPADEQ